MSGSGSLIRALERAMRVAFMQAMIQVAGLNLSGKLGVILLLAAGLALPVSFGLIWLYRRTVLRSMRTRASSLTTEFVPLVTATPPRQPMQASPDLTVVDSASFITTDPAAETLYAEVLHAPWRSAAIYAVAGACYALIMAMAYTAANKNEFLPIRILYLFWIHAWPIVLTVNLVAAATRRAKLATTIIYFLTFAAVGTIFIATIPDRSWSSAAMLWLVHNLPTTILLFTFLNRRVQAVGPLVLIFMFLPAIGSQLGLFVEFVANRNEGLHRSILEVGSIMGLSENAIYYGITVLGFVMLGPAGWLILR